MKIILIHGFASIGPGQKHDALVSAFGEENVFAPTLPIGPDIVENHLDQIVDDVKTRFPKEPIVFIGSSLGGFWAHYMSQKHKSPSIIVNPTLAPSSILVFFAGTTFVNYQTNMPFVIPIDIVSKFAVREHWLRENARITSLMNLFLAKDDNILDYNVTLRAVPVAASICVKEDGGHRFIDHWHEVVNKAKSFQSQGVR